MSLGWRRGWLVWLPVPSASVETGPWICFKRRWTGAKI